MTSLINAWPSIVAAFLGSLVECVEALTIILAVGSVRGWRPALTGTLAGILFLTTVVLFFGPMLSSVPLRPLQLVIGMLLLLFGMCWLRKAMLRSAGSIPLRDEVAQFSAESTEMRAAGPVQYAKLDKIAVLTSFKTVVLEGIEVAFIVVAIGSAGDMLLPASMGAAFAGLLVAAVGMLIHRPLARFPENAIKFTVGILLSSFGCFWIGEGMALPWPGDELAIIAMIASLMLSALFTTQIARRWIRSAKSGVKECQ